MGKRSAFERRERDYYPTPASAVLPLLPHLVAGSDYAEPCAGTGELIDALAEHRHVCTYACDIEPHADQRVADARTLKLQPSQFITNPPWARDQLHPIIVNLSDQALTWLLFDADWIHTRQAFPYLPRLRKIVAVGRVKWIPDSPYVGKDNCAWHMFSKPSSAPTQFFGRTS